MHRTNTLFAFVVALCITASAYAQSSDKQPSPGANPDQGDSRGQGMGRSDQDTGSRDRGGAMGDRAMQAGSKLNAQIDQQFEQEWVKQALSGNLYEVQLGQLVSEKGQDASVKQLAQRLVQDHQQAADQLKQVAQQMNVPVSDELNPVHRAKLDELRQKPAQQLDLAFVFCAIGDHTKGALEYQFVAQNAQNAQLKQYASQTLPHLIDHLRMARQLSPVSMGEARTAGERMGPSGGADTGHRGGDHDRTGGSSGTGGTGGRTGDR